MAKPASGTALDTGHALYTSLAAVWGMLEGSGTTSADSTGNGHTLTLNNTGSGVSWTTIGGDAALAFAGCTTTAATAGGTIALAGTASWSFAWRGKQTNSDNNGMVLSEEVIGGDRTQLFMRGFNYLRFVPHSGNLFYNFTDGPTDFTSDANYLLVYDQPNALLHFYKNGSEVATALSVSANDAALTLVGLGSGKDSAATFSLVGTLTYAYLWSGRALTLTDAGTLNSTPYAIFSTGAATPIIRDLAHAPAWQPLVAM